MQISATKAISARHTLKRPKLTKPVPYVIRVASTATERTLDESV